MLRIKYVLGIRNQLINSYQFAIFYLQLYLRYRIFNYNILLKSVFKSICLESTNLISENSRTLLRKLF